ncbi:hypothetical protein I2I05_06160 [Hymenobacter sp. BT683]|uniref:Lipoprotein n=1 Tax=Hymenobacter jeongseonensis TaxID=2791027 RepID=A0ABS0IG15_9BACT|nr:hypothetical protein [Hymenobacter jeongseonensis]MBF9236974.1 hypothetical protein [Hymenobacter jeongseonensis]
MKNSLLILAGAAALSLASCSQEKTTDTTVAAGDGMTTTTTTTTTGPMTDAQIEARAQRIADKMVADMKITDEATKTKIRTVYVNRYRQMGEMQTKYATDTTGMAAAMRESMATTDAEFKTIFADPTQYQAYESSRMTYYGMEDDEPEMSTTTDMNSDMSTTTTEGTMSAEGGKMKVKADGDVKIKDAQGNKTKIDGDDGTIKMKEEEGGKSVIK